MHETKETASFVFEKEQVNFTIPEDTNSEKGKKERREQQNFVHDFTYYIQQNYTKLPPKWN